MKSIAVIGCAAMLLAVAVPAAAQQPRATRDAKYRLGQLERILEGAAEHGAKGAQDRFKVMLPGDFLLTDDVRVRGFMIGEWGVFFDVQMPPLESTTPWIVRTLDQNDLDLVNAVRIMTSMAQATNDPALRQSNLQAVERVSLQLGLSAQTISGQAPNVQTVNTQTQVNTQTVNTPAAPPATQGRAVEAATFTGDVPLARAAAPAPTPAPASVSAAVPDNPQAAFHAEVKAAIIDAMLEHGSSLRLKPEQKFMVAIRGADNLPRLAPGEPESPTIYITILAADLMAAAANQVSREEALKRVVVDEVP
jgi:nucleoid-associated protein YgaU